MEEYICLDESPKGIVYRNRDDIQLGCVNNYVSKSKRFLRGFKIGLMRTYNIKINVVDRLCKVFIRTGYIIEVDGTGKPVGRPKLYSDENVRKEYNIVGQQNANLYCKLNPARMYKGLIERGVKISERTVRYHMKYDMHIKCVEIKFCFQFKRDHVNEMNKKLKSVQYMDHSDNGGITNSAANDVVICDLTSEGCESDKSINSSCDAEWDEDIPISPEYDTENETESVSSSTSLLSVASIMRMGPDLHRFFQPDGDWLSDREMKVLCWEGVPPPSAPLASTVNKDHLQRQDWYIANGGADTYRYYPVMKSEVIVCLCVLCRREKEEIETRKKLYGADDTYTQGIVVPKYSGVMTTVRCDDSSSEDESDELEVYDSAIVGSKRQRQVVDEDGKVMFSFDYN